MKIKNEFVIRHIADEIILIPVGEAASASNGIISLSESGELLIQKLQNECDLEELVTCLTDEYEVSREQAGTDVLKFIDQLRERSLME